MTATAALEGGLIRLDLDVSLPQRECLGRYLTLLQRWNRVYNLTAIRDPERMVTHHLLDSLAIVPDLPAAADARIADVGSGAGLPGIPLAIVRPCQRYTLIDSNQKKGAFLRQSVIDLELSNVEIVVARVEDYRPALLFRAVVSRAFASLATFARVAGHLVEATGRLLAMKSATLPDERDALPADMEIEAVRRLAVPGLDVRRELVTIKRRS